MICGFFIEETPSKWKRVETLAANLDGKLLRIGTVQVNFH